MNIAVTTGLLVVILASLSFPTASAMRKENCEACFDFIDAFKENVKDIDDDLRKDSDAMGSILKEFCENSKDKAFRRICYYIGGLKDSATSILKEVTKPVMGHLPTEKICDRLNKKDAQICEVRIKKKRNLGDVDLKKLRVKELKNILNDWDRGDACKVCVEKSDFVEKVLELMPQYDPDSWKARQAKQEL